MSATTTEALTDQQILTLPNRYNHSDREGLFKYGGRKFEKIWNSNGELRSIKKHRAGPVGDLYKSMLPDTSDEMWVGYASEKLDHLHYATGYLANEIRKRSLISDFKTVGSVNELALLVTAHFIVDRSFKGFYAERQVLKEINGSFHEEECTARFASADEDRKYGIDIFVDESFLPGFSRQYGIQVKPISFFIGNTNRGLVADRNRLFSKIRKTEAIYGIQVKWFVFEKQPNFLMDTLSLLTTEEAFLLAYGGKSLSGFQKY